MGRAGRWQAGRVIGLTTRHKLSPIGDGEPMNVTSPKIVIRDQSRPAC